MMETFPRTGAKQQSQAAKIYNQRNGATLPQRIPKSGSSQKGILPKGIKNKGFSSSSKEVTVHTSGETLFCPRRGIGSVRVLEPESERNRAAENAL